MANEIQKCPMCGTRLKMINDRMTCKNCGYYVRSQQEQTASGASYEYPVGQPSNAAAQTDAARQDGGSFQDNGSGQNGSSYQNNGSGQNGSPYQNNASGQNGSPYQNSASFHPASIVPPMEPKKNSGTIIAVISIISAVVLIGAAAFLVTLFSNTADILDHAVQYGSHAGSASPSSSDLLDYLVNSMENDASVQPTEQPAVRRKIPQSTFFIQMAEEIWNKGYRVITAEEYDSLTALKIDTDEKTITYQLNHGDSQVLTFQSYTDKKLSDLGAFTGLEFLSIDDDLDRGDLDGLYHLYAVYAENSIEELLKIIPSPENIEELGVESTFFEKSLEGLESFPSLLYLSVDYDDLEDISLLAQFPNLLGLTLEDCDDLTDYSPLMSLTKLEVLGIASSQLKTIDFIKAMPNLTHLRIEDSKITSLEALKSCPNLVLLSLTDNYQIKDDDYSAVSELEMLEDLTISLGHIFNLPSLEKLTRLERLYLKNVDDPAPLKDAVNVTSLVLDDISWWDLEVLVPMENLFSLTLKDCHLYTLEPLTRLSSLMILDLEDTNIYGNIEEIFGIPGLYYLNLSECQGGIDFDNLPVNESLQILNLNEFSIMKDPSFGSNDRTTIEMSTHYELFDSFPFLTELSLASDRIDSIEFVENLPLLQYLDITNNNVTSLKPLEELQDFQIVRCGRNTILEGVSEKSGITVITND